MKLTLKPYGNNSLQISNNGQLREVTGSSSSNGGISLTSQSISTSPLVLNLASGQTANTIEINSFGQSGGDLLKINASGRITVVGGTYDTYIDSSGFEIRSTGTTTLLQSIYGGSTLDITNNVNGDQIRLFTRSSLGTLAATVIVDSTVVQIRNNTPINILDSANVAIAGQVNVDATNNFISQHAFTSGSSYYGNQSASNTTGSAIIQTAGTNRIVVGPSGDTSITPDVDVTGLAVSASGNSPYAVLSTNASTLTNVTYFGRYSSAVNGVVGSVTNNSASGGQGIGVAGAGRASGTNGTAIGVSGQVFNTSTNAVGVMGFVSTGVTAACGGLFFLDPSSLGYTIANLATAALIADNTSWAAPIFLAKDNGSTVMQIADGGNAGFGGSHTPAAIIHAVSNTSTLLRVGYDTSFYSDFDVSSAGVLTITPVGQKIIAVGDISFNNVAYKLDLGPSFGYIQSVASGQFGIRTWAAGAAGFIIGNTQGTPTSIANDGNMVIGTLHANYNTELFITGGGSYADGQTAGDLTLHGGQNWQGGTNANGGSVNICPGIGSGTGLDGNVRINYDGSAFGGKTGINTSAPDKQLEINSSTGDCLRLTYNDNNGSATNYVDQAVSSGGNLTVTPSGGATLLSSSLEVANVATHSSITAYTPSGAAQVVTVDWPSSNLASIDLDAATGTTTVNFTTPGNPCHLTLKIIADTVNTPVFTWGSLDWGDSAEPTWATSKTYIIPIYFDGTTYYGGQPFVT